MLHEKFKYVKHPFGTQSDMGIRWEQDMFGHASIQLLSGACVQQKHWKWLNLCYFC